MAINCAFCHIDDLGPRVIHDDRTKSVYSMLSNPALSDFHALVIPRRHIDPSVDVMTEQETRDEKMEVDTLQDIFRKLGFKGVDIWQKTRGFIPEGTGGTKMDHYHMHVLPSNPGDRLYTHGIIWGEPDAFAVRSLAMLSKQVDKIRTAESRMEDGH